MIPKTIHIIWIGDESRRPDNCIATWAKHNSDWQIKLWGNEDLANYGWVNAEHMREMAKRELNGVADMMRWEILYNEGGFLVDADSICVRSLEDDLLACEAFACWESEMVRPGLIAAGYFGSIPGNPFLGQIVLDIKAESSVVNDRAWKTVGPQRLTESYRRYAYHALKILPSHTFIPEHFSGLKYDGNGTVYARQMWGSTLRAYDSLHKQRFGADGLLIDDPEFIQSEPARVPESDPLPQVAGSVSPLELKHHQTFVQKVDVASDLIGVSRIEAFARLCAGRRVLHMGCADWPITSVETSLHLALEKHCRQLDGFDIHPEALELLAPHVKGRLFSRMEDVTDSYDIVLVPEVLEHVPDIQGFLKQLDAFDAPHYVITVPDAYQCSKGHFDFNAKASTFVEIVHPDHNFWFSPYTFANVIRKYTDWTIDGIWFFNRISLLAVLSKPKTGALKRNG